MRTVILHYHLFKNAGTSLDRILKRNFGEAWVTAEFPTSRAGNSDQVAAWIADTPDAIAYSSHTMFGPLPRVDNVQIIPVMLLRDPVARIRSAYQFERAQDADTWGAQLAKEHDFAGYVRTRLERRGDRQCRNFQTSRLASMTLDDAPELDRAIASARMLQRIGVLGRVENFDRAMEALKQRLEPDFPGFEVEAVRTNISAKPKTPPDQSITALLIDANADDIAVLDALD